MIAEIPRTSLYDAVVIGAGPAGSSAAHQLAKAGWRVALVEKEVLGRSRVCGGFMGPEALFFFKQMGLEEALAGIGAEPVEELLLSAPQARPVHAPLSSSNTENTAWAFDRARFDRYLAEKAREAGADLLFRTRTVRLEKRHGVYALDLEDEEKKFRLYAEKVIDATGRRQPARAPEECFFALKTV